MVDAQFPAPTEGFVLTHFLVVSDQDRSRQWYERVLGATTVLERDPVIMQVANSWIILNVGGGPTEDKPDVTLQTPSDPHRTGGAFLNIRVADIASAYREWSAAGERLITQELIIENRGWTSIKILEIGRSGPGLDLLGVSSPRQTLPYALGPTDELAMTLTYQVIDCAAVTSQRWRVPVRVERPWGVLTVYVSPPTKTSDTAPEGWRSYVGADPDAMEWQRYLADEVCRIGG